MAFSAMTKPTQGDPTKKSEIDQLIDNDDYLKAQVDVIKSEQVLNGSFETPTSGTPTGWTLTLYTGGSGAIDTTDPAHGDQCFMFTHPSGASNGGGYLESEAYFEVSPNRALLLSWEQKSSAAGVRNKVTLYWYTSALVAISSSDIYDSTANPTSWTAQSGSATPPSNARFAKIRITGGLNTTDPGSSTTIRFDNFYFKSGQIIPTIEVNPSSPWTVPSGVTRIRVKVWGGGGGGGGGSSTTVIGAGGGAGGYGEDVFSVTPGTAYTATVGAGGAGGSSGNTGSTGGTTSLGALISATGGVGGATSTGAGGAGGTSSATINITGGQGQRGQNSTVSGVGGAAGGGGAGAPGIIAAGTGVAGAAPGGGGGGAYGANTGGAGGAGRIIIEY